MPDAIFDRAYSQNVIMNIADKDGFYREAFRAIKPGGKLALSNVCAGPGGEPYYPVPWAATPETSFLATPDDARRDIVAAGFEIVSFENTTAAILPATLRHAERIEKDGLPPLGVHVIVGERIRKMQINSARAYREGRLATIEVLARKPPR